MPTALVEKVLVAEENRNGLGHTSPRATAAAKADEELVSLLIIRDL